jgi:hypothetical protein
MADVEQTVRHFVEQAVECIGSKLELQPLTRVCKLTAFQKLQVQKVLEAGPEASVTFCALEAKVLTKVKQTN